MAVSDRPVCVLCGFYVNIFMENEAVYFSCGHVEHADCFFFKHPSDNRCQKCGTKSLCIIFKYVAHF